MVLAQTRPKVMFPPPTLNFHAGHWQHRAAWQSSWHALETSFGRGESFLHTLHAWQQDTAAPDRLFFTAFATESPQHLSPLIAEACFGLLPGVHRIVFEHGKVQLTLCIGPPSNIAREIDVSADSIRMEALDAWDARQIGRLCHVGSALTWTDASTKFITELAQTGVQITDPSTGVFRPQWTPKTALRPRFENTSPKHAVVIGAGLSGAAVAHSLACRGWTVEVLDQGNGLGAGASGLPAGIFATHVSPDNNVLSRITRDGVRATLQRAKQLLKQGTHWQLSHLLEHRYDGKRQLPSGGQWPSVGHEWSTEATEKQKVKGGLLISSKALWHPLAGWIQPPAFVKAQLAHPNISLRSNCQVRKLQQTHSEWQVLNENGQCIAQSKLMVLANAHQCQSLLETVALSDPSPQVKRPYLPATALRGQVTWGKMNDLPDNLCHALPQFPVNGHGSYIGNLTSFNNNPNDKHWIVGSSFQRNDLDLSTRPEDQQSNIQQWAELMPAFQENILNNIDLSRTYSWAAIRSALPDRVPAVGEFAHPEFKGLHVCTGMGARGISWSVLCGELLAAHLNHEPLPMAASLAKRMAASRFG